MKLPLPSLPLAAIITVIWICPSLAQQDLHADTPTTSSPFKFSRLQVEEAALPGSKKKWTKIICSFTSPLEWVDGLSFNFIALVGKESSEKSLRIISGGETYMNVPCGESKAIMYMSANATTRFGQPVAVKVDIYRGDLQVGTYTWTNGQVSLPTDWTNKYSTFEGILQPMRFTPWLLIDSDKTPDASTY